MKSLARWCWILVVLMAAPIPTHAQCSGKQGPREVVDELRAGGPLGPGEARCADGVDAIDPAPAPPSCRKGDKGDDDGDCRKQPDCKHRATPAGDCRHRRTPECHGDGPAECRGQGGPQCPHGAGPQCRGQGGAQCSHGAGPQCRGQGGARCPHGDGPAECRGQGGARCSHGSDEGPKASAAGACEHGRNAPEGRCRFVRRFLM